MTDKKFYARLEEPQACIMPMNDDYLSKCVVDVVKRKIYIYSTEGNEKEVTCDTVEEFMNVLEYIRATVDDDILSYATP